MVDQAAANFGRLDVLVNNAALMTRAEAFDLTAEAWDRYMAINVRAPYVAIREVAPVMMRQGSGSIINITAGAAGLEPKNNYPGTLPYAVSKAALNRLTYYVAAELRPHGIAVNALSPGMVLSESVLAANPAAAMAGTHKPSTPETLGPALLWLATQTAHSFTGRILHTDDFQKSWP
jgi:NAD(P)-dependent dehydrogenase (short-subunit alcohol dehydrogenase family)